MKDIIGMNDALIVFTDGACSCNGKTYAKGGYSTVWPEHPEMNGGWALEGEKVTNNRAEFMGLVKALEIADIIDPSRSKRLEVYTDSMFLINCMNKWLPGWKKNGFKKADRKPVLNQDLLLTLDKLRMRRFVVLNHVRAHTSNNDWKSINNAKADELARAATS